MATSLTGIRGAQYLPFQNWNAFQFWKYYDNSVIKRELDYAEILGLDTLRVHASYEYWYIEATDDTTANRHISHLHHFLSECSARGIRPIIELFESPPKRAPTETNREAPFLPGTSYSDAGGVHSPARQPIPLYDYNIQNRNWTGLHSPMHFVRRMANGFGDDTRVRAFEIMNEPGDVQPRQDFVVDMITAFRQENTSATLTLGCKAPRFNEVYEERTGGALDVHQFHMNLPKDTQDARTQLAAASTHAQEWGKPIWCTEWQRTLEEPPNKFIPNYKSLAPTIHEAVDTGQIQGTVAWGLMLNPAYLRDPRSKGRFNGIFHPDGSVFDVEDARAVARDGSLSVTEKRALPAEWDDHPFPYPDPDSDGGGGMNKLVLAALVGGGLWFGTRSLRGEGR